MGTYVYFVHPIFRFLFLVTFGDEVMKILRNLCLHFARQDGQDGKKWKENHATKVTKIPKTKRQNSSNNEYPSLEHLVLHDFYPIQ
jgi:hypothetical protein